MGEKRILLVLVLGGRVVAAAVAAAAVAAAMKVARMVGGLGDRWG